jgi:hypothetical protein
MSEAGKGDTQRQTDMDEFRKNWERIFGKPSTSNTPKPPDRPHPEPKKD